MPPRGSVDVPNAGAGHRRLRPAVTSVASVAPLAPRVAVVVVARTLPETRPVVQAQFGPEDVRRGAVPLRAIVACGGVQRMTQG